MFTALRDEAALHSGGDREGRIELPKLSTGLSVGEVEVEAETSVVTAEIVAHHNDLRKPLAFVAVGSGDDVAEATRNAARQWFDVVYPVMHSLFADHPTDNVVAGNLSAVNSANEQFFWRVHLGPVRVVCAGKAAAPPMPESWAMLQAVLNAVTGIAGARSERFWVDAYAARQNDGTLMCECRLDNVRWDEGTAALADYASKLPVEGSFLISHRQFMFFEPQPAPSGSRTKPAKKSRWWRRFFD